MADRFRAIYRTSLTTVVGLGPLLTRAMVLVLNDLGLYRHERTEEAPGTAPA